MKETTRLEEEKTKTNLTNSEVEDVPGEEIISRLYQSDCIRFRLTCKSMMSMVPKTRPIPEKFIQFWSQTTAPWFIFSTIRGLTKIFHPIYNDSYQVKMPEEIIGAHIYHAKYGWLLMSKDRFFFFFNPVTGRTIRLPVLPPGGKFTGVTFSSPPTSSDCIIFGHVQSLDPMNANILFCRHGQSTWQEHEVRCNAPFTMSFCNPVFHNGLFYCLDTQGKLGVFVGNLNENSHDFTWNWNVLSEPIGNLNENSHDHTWTGFNITMSYMAELDRDILAIFVGPMGNPIHVYKLDWSDMKWVQLQDLGRNVLYLCRATSLLVPATEQGTENRIYFPRFHIDRNSLLPPFRVKDMVFYSLDRGQYRSFGCNSSSSKQDWFDTLEYEYCCTWFEPKVDNTPCGEQIFEWFSNNESEDEEYEEDELEEDESGEDESDEEESEEDESDQDESEQDELEENESDEDELDKDESEQDELEENESDKDESSEEESEEYESDEDESWDEESEEEESDEDKSEGEKIQVKTNQKEFSELHMS